MGLFGNLFSKQTCVICNAEVGALSRHKLKDGNYICNKCRKNASGYFQPKFFDTKSAKMHLAYMDKINELYEKEYAGLDKSQKDCGGHHGSNMIWFADGLGMFEIINHATKKSDKKQLFRYDEIESFGAYEVLNSGSDENQRRYAEIGLQITMRLKDNLERVFPYPVVIKLPLETNVDSPSFDIGNRVFIHLNEIFGAEMSTGAKVASGAASMLFGGSAPAAMMPVTGFSSENREKYTKLADDAERRVFGKTIKEILG